MHPCRIDSEKEDNHTDRQTDRHRDSFHIGAGEIEVHTGGEGSKKEGKERRRVREEEKGEGDGRKGEGRKGGKERRGEVSGVE